MGVLDDAIREHLELKRLHGAGEDEVRRQEEEALGPARREVAPEESDDGEQTATEVEAEQPELSEASSDEAAAPPAETLPSTDENEALDETPPEGFEAVEEEYPAEPAEVEGPLEDEDELEELDDEELLEDDDGDPDEDADVLQDTPDFLQETPEHDRLWFEQKPPRDFDFD